MNKEETRRAAYECLRFDTVEALRRQLHLVESVGKAEVVREAECVIRVMKHHVDLIHSCEEEIAKCDDRKAKAVAASPKETT